MEIGKVIKTLITKRGLTQLEVSKRIGISTTALSQIITGHYQPSSDTLKLISETINVPVPVIHFLCVTEDDVPQERKEIFKFLKPSFDQFISAVFMLDNDILKSLN